MNLYAPTIAPGLPMSFERRISFSVTNASRNEAKITYITLNTQTPCPPRGAVPVNQGPRGRFFHSQRPVLSVMDATVPAMSATLMIQLCPSVNNAGGEVPATSPPLKIHVLHAKAATAWSDCVKGVASPLRGSGRRRRELSHRRPPSPVTPLTRGKNPRPHRGGKWLTKWLTNHSETILRNSATIVLNHL
jgi:hypothetical protein